MEILYKWQKEKNSGHHVLVFGLGMIGGAIRNALTLQGYKLHSHINMDWRSPDKLKSNLTTISAALANLPEKDHLSFVWSAGKARFNTPPEQINQEQRTFSETIDTLLLRSNIVGTRCFRFHMISSAGGLFEGQSAIKAGSKATPLRPYGHYKLEQEKALLSKLGNQNVFIYRPSSVFGPAKDTMVPGLINILIGNNTNAHSITSLDAHVMALRDYVFSEDIGRYVARQIATDDSQFEQPEYFFLVSGRSASIFEVVRTIESVLHTKLLVRYDQNYGNSADMTFSPSLMPADWRPSDLKTGIRLALSVHHSATHR